MNALFAVMQIIIVILLLTGAYLSMDCALVKTFYVYGTAATLIGLLCVHGAVCMHGRARNNDSAEVLPTTTEEVGKVPYETIDQKQSTLNRSGVFAIVLYGGVRY